MTAFDLAVIGVIVLSGVFAYSRGFVREALSIASWLLAGAAAYYAFPYASPFFARFLPRGTIADVAAASAVFIVALAIAHLIAKALAGHVKRSPLSSIDRALGLIFGVLRGLVLVTIAYIVLAWALPPGNRQPRWFAQSRTVPLLRAGAEKLESYFGRRPRAAAPNRAIEREAEKAMRAFTKPVPRAPAKTDTPPAYTPSEQRNLNRLIEQQNGP